MKRSYLTPTALGESVALEDSAMMSQVEVNRNVLRERIRQSGYVFNRDWSNMQPLVSIDEYFAEGLNEVCIGNSRIILFGIAAFGNLLRAIKRRDDVSDILIEIDDDFDDGWPHRDYIFLSTACDADDIAGLFAPIAPDLILTAGRTGPWVRARTIRLDEINIAPGHQLWALRWHWDMDDDE